MGAAVGAAMTFWLAGPAQAGVYTDDLSKCLVKSSTVSDQTDLVTWVFVAMTVHPAVQRYSSVTDEQRTASDKTAAALLQRLLTQDCRKEAVEALKYEGQSSIESSFSVLGQVAMRGLMSDPKVAQSMGGLAKFIDNSKFEALAKEAGLDKAKPDKK